MEKIFKRVRNQTLSKIILRIGLGVLFFIVGLILSLIFNDILYILIAVMLCMLESIILIALGFIKNKNANLVKKVCLINYMPDMNFKTNNKFITEAYKIFSYNDYFNIGKIHESIEGDILDVKINSVTIDGKINYKRFYIRIYRFIFKDKINFKISPNMILGNYRYEIKDNKLFLSIIDRKANNITFNPVYFKEFLEYENRFKRENEILKYILKCGGLEHEEFNN